MLLRRIAHRRRLWQALGTGMTSSFTFLSHERNVELLKNRLQKVGIDRFDVHESSSAYTPARVELSCPWIADLAVVFSRRWWSDGTTQEDEDVTLRVNGLAVPVLNVGELLRAKLDRPLPELIVQKLKEAVARSIRDARIQKAT